MVQEDATSTPVTHAYGAILSIKGRIISHSLQKHGYYAEI
jgi:hypothetical protein